DRARLRRAQSGPHPRDPAGYPDPNDAGALQLFLSHPCPYRGSGAPHARAPPRGCLGRNRACGQKLGRAGQVVHRAILMFAFDASFWRERPVFVTGHTGFKGAWLVLWLAGLGARVSGLSLPPYTDPNLFDLCARGRCGDTFGDIADHALLARALADCAPEIVIHMAAQALVRPSYVDPLGTYATNVMGTANLLQAVRSVPSVRAVIVVTSDKVYENDGAGRPFTEDDRLGGHDPYSNSKACAELVTDSFRRCFFGDACRVATARAGNVIGGGGWAAFPGRHGIVQAGWGGKPVAVRCAPTRRP